MAWAKRINKKKYLSGTLINLSFAVYAGWPNLVQVLSLSYIVIGAFLNHYFTILVFDRFVMMVTQKDDAPSKKKLAFHLFLKLLFLISAFVCLLVFSREKVIQGLTLYIFQLIIFSLSIKNIEHLFKKGSPS